MENRAIGFDRGQRRRANPDYTRMIRTGRVNRDKYTPPLMGSDTLFKRMRYVRYADDFLVGIAGSREDCKIARSEIAEFLKEKLDLTLNVDKTKITHARDDSASFLGYKIHITDPSKYPLRYVSRTTRPVLDAPIAKLVNKLAEAGYCKRGGKPRSCGRLIHEPVQEIVKRYLLLERGLINYYHMATNYGRTAARIHFILKYSCVLTLARKMKLKTAKRVFRTYGGTLGIKGSDGKTIASYPKISYAKPRVNTVDPFNLINDSAKFWKRSLDATNLVCLLCRATEGIEMHHVRHLRKGKSKNWLTQRMIAMNRKQIPVCRDCRIHNGVYDGVSLRK